MPFDANIEKNIFQPLAMNRTTFRQPLPDNLKPLMSEGYKKSSEPAKPYEFVQAWPAGSVSTTACVLDCLLPAIVAQRACVDLDESLEHAADAGFSGFQSVRAELANVELQLAVLKFGSGSDSIRPSPFMMFAACLIS